MFMISISVAPGGNKVQAALPTGAGYPADFIFTSDLKWIVRVQKLGSGTSTLHLYRLTPP